MLQGTLGEMELGVFVSWGALASSVMGEKNKIYKLAKPLCMNAARSPASR